MRFSIRDLLWATLVVAMGLGWWVDRTKLLSDLGRESQRTKTWRLRTGAIEKGLKDNGWQVAWEPNIVRLRFDGPTMRMGIGARTDRYEPSVLDEPLVEP